MEVLEIKTRIHQLVDELPEESLQQVYSFLRQVDKPSPLSPERQKLLDDIINENRELLQRLAQ